jgi:hypothetical protein
MKQKSIILFLFLAVVIALAGCQPQSQGSELTASLSELSGLVELKQAGENAFVQASADTVLAVNGQVQTGDDGRVRLDLSTGTIVRVAPSSFFTLTANEPVEGGLLTKIKLEAGKIFVILNGGQADVETPSGVASVRGSYMKVEVDPVTKVIKITCLEGQCSASNPAGSVNFTNGQSVILNPPNNEGNWNPPEEFLEWLNENPEAQQVYEQVIAELTEEPTEVPTEEPTATPTTAVEQALPPAGASNACSVPQEPTDGSVLGKIGQVQFNWTEQPGAQTYILTFLNADGSRARVETTSNSASLFIEVLPAGGEYTWFVTALGADGTEICSSASITFSKPKADPTQKPTPEDKPEPPTEAPTEPSCSEADLCDTENEACFDYDYWQTYCSGS